MLEFGKYVSKFDDRIERHVASRGWFSEPPAKAVKRWAGRGTLAIVAGVIVFIIGFNLPSQGLVLMGGALVAAGILIILIARAMPQRTMAGAMIYAMLAAYRRTLQKTMEQARSMNQVVQEANLSWLETPDQAVVWGVALGLQEDVEAGPRAQRRGRPAGRHDVQPVGADVVWPGLGRRHEQRWLVAASRRASSRARASPTSAA